MDAFVKRCISTCALTVAGVLCAGIVSAEMTTEGIIAYWPMEDDIDIVDVFGGNDGIPGGEGDIDLVKGKFGNGLEFDGTAEVHIEGTDALNLAGAEAFSVSVWANTGSDDPVVGVVDGCCGSIVAQRDVNGWALRYDGRNPGMEIEFIVNDGGWQGDGGFGAPRPNAGEWHHYAAVLDNGSTRFYFDGELLMEGVAGALASVGMETEIGHAGDGGFVGIIDEAAIYGIALSDDQVMANFETPGLAVDPVGKLATEWASLKGLR